MGGRGSSTGVSDHGIPYGREYHSLLTVGNIKFVVKLSGSTTAPMETMTKGRVYVTISPKGELKFISYYDNKNTLLNEDLSRVNSELFDSLTINYSDRSK